MLRHYTSRILRRRVTLVIAWVAIAGLAAFVAASGTEFTSDYRAYFAPDNPELVAYNTMEAEFTGDDNVFIVVAPRDGDVFTQNVLTVIEQITEQSWQVPHAQRVDSLTNFQNIESRDGDLFVGPLVEDASSLTDDRLIGVKSVALSEPALVDRLVSSDGTVTGVFITLRFPGDDHRAHIPETVEFVRSMIDGLRADHPDLRFALSGTAIISYSLDEITLRDLLILSPILYVVLLIVLAVLLRSLSGTLASAIVITVAAAGAMGFAAWAGIQLTSASVVAPIIILTLAVADSVHFIASAQDARHTGMSKTEALAESMRINFEPIFLTSLTTFIGFLSLNFSASPPFRDLGNITAAGVVVAWVASISLLPAVLSFLPLPPQARGLAGASTMKWIADAVVINRWRILVVAFIVAGVFSAMAPLNRLDDQVIEWFGERTDIRRDTEFITDELTGPYRVDFSVVASEPGGISNPAYLVDLDAFARWLEQQPEVVHVDDFADVMRRLNQAMNEGREDFYRLPEAQDLAAQYLLLYELSLPYGLDLTTQINFDKSATRVSATLGRVSSAQTRELKARAEAWALENLSTAHVAEGTGTAVMFAFVSQRTINSMLGGTALAFALISLTLLVALRNVRLGLLSLIPNVLPVVVTFGIWWLVVGQIGVVASAIAAMTLGLVVDDTVHFLSKYHRARKEHRLSVHDGIRFAFEHVGSAMLTTTVVLVAGFSVMMFSDFLINWQMGVLTVLTISIALILDFLLLPSLLMFLDRERFCMCKTCLAARAS